MRTHATIQTDDGIQWYYEQEGSGPHIILIPDGIGDCWEFNSALPLIAGHGFTVTTFDNPGMSRSSNAPEYTYQDVTAPKLASQVIGLMDKLSIDQATVWGSSSGGATVLALVALYPQRVRNALPHEVPMGEQAWFKALMDADDETISKITSDGFATRFPGDIEKWEGLGQEFHGRLWKNYPRWVRGYGSTLTPSIPDSEQVLKSRPMDWSVGADTPNSMFLENIVKASQAGITVRTLPGSHFPYISDPQAFSDYIITHTSKYL